ncbi:DUF411 domain-containing protein [Candidatus Woesearchaeota archaeon]|nr:DUF411 domain-containing protein [Candidatus Woesearchaeota archaeon]
MKKIIFLIFLVFAAILAYGCSSSNPTGNAVKEAKAKATIFKDSSCGCCDVYSQYLGKKGYSAEAVTTQNMDAIKTKYNIPYSMQSCHTVVIGDYFVEGHMPIEAIEKLMAEKPDIAGIALPGMPSGAPGMTGSKLNDFVVYAVHKDGTTSEFMRI